ncbi:MAG TPA: cytochrome o ubiquinol oxidase subunit IV [Candidatus Saccharimonadales bacterium]|nr:cytochrome o ubiquinol oxidase subunit IV [Candidatus Saccharimonadales bacterium]
MSSSVIHGQLDSERGTLRSYATGFVLSIVLTVAAYLLATHHALSGKVLMAALLGLAVIQFIAQLFFFLHIGRETKPRWRLLTLFMMITVVLIVVIGSIWIMYNLNYRMTPAQINQYMQKQADSGF